jgi:putative photosynthetic complex assembly protein
MPRALASPTSGPRPAGTWPHPLWLVLVLGLAMSFWLGEGDASSIAPPEAAARQERRLHFRDGPGGSILVVDAVSGRTVEQLDGELGFVRGALRALVRERRRAGFDAAQPFALREGADGRIWLADPPSGARLALDAFGADNAARFAAWLPRPPGGAPAGRLSLSATAGATP